MEIMVAIQGAIDFRRSLPLIQRATSFTVAGQRVHNPVVTPLGLNTEPATHPERRRWTTLSFQLGSGRYFNAPFDFSAIILQSNLSTLLIQPQKILQRDRIVVSNLISQVLCHQYQMSEKPLLVEVVAPITHAQTLQ